MDVKCCGQHSSCIHAVRNSVHSSGRWSLFQMNINYLFARVALKLPMPSPG